MGSESTWASSVGQSLFSTRWVGLGLITWKNTFEYWALWVTKCFDNLGFLISTADSVSLYFQQISTFYSKNKEIRTAH